MATPLHGTYPAYFEKYINLAEAENTQELIDKYSEPVWKFFKNIPNKKTTYRYAEGKWSLKELLQHIIDTERIFAYRALTIARQDTNALPGFDENAYAAVCHADNRTWKSLLKEFKAVRKSTNMLINSFTDEELQQSGTTNGNPNTTVAISFVIFGHILHHINIVNERYL